MSFDRPDRHSSFTEVPADKPPSRNVEFLRLWQSVRHGPSADRRDQLEAFISDLPNDDPQNETFRFATFLRAFGPAHDALREQRRLTPGERLGIYQDLGAFATEILKAPNFNDNHYGALAETVGLGLFARGRRTPLLMPNEPQPPFGYIGDDTYVPLKDGEGFMVEVKFYKHQPTVRAGHSVLRVAHKILEVQYEGETRGHSRQVRQEATTNVANLLADEAAGAQLRDEDDALLTAVTDALDRKLGQDYKQGVGRDLEYDALL